MRTALKPTLIAVVALALGAQGAFAQGIQSAGDAPQEGEEIKGDTGVVEINEVERGFYLSIDAGPNHYLNIDALTPPTFVKIGRPLYDPAQPITNGFSPGTRIGLRAGYDILNNVNAEMFVMANFNEGFIDSDQLAAGALTGDLSHFVVGLGGRFALLTLPVEYPRWFIFGRAGVGYALWFPSQLVPAGPLPFGSLHVDGSVGVEYYTHLRHLSVGLEVGVQSLMLPFAFGIQIYPTIKYTF